MTEEGNILIQQKISLAQDLIIVSKMVTTQEEIWVWDTTRNRMKLSLGKKHNFKAVCCFFLNI